MHSSGRPGPAPDPFPGPEPEPAPHHARLGERKGEEDPHRVERDQVSGAPAKEHDQDAGKDRKNQNAIGEDQLIAQTGKLAWQEAIDTATKAVAGRR